VELAEYFCFISDQRVGARVSGELENCFWRAGFGEPAAVEGADGADGEAIEDLDGYTINQVVGVIHE
jgi:hypothetical protein